MTSLAFHGTSCMRASTLTTVRFQLLRGINNERSTNATSASSLSRFHSLVTATTSRGMSKHVLHRATAAAAVQSNFLIRRQNVIPSVLFHSRWKSHRSTSTRMPGGPQYGIAKSSLIRSNAMIQSPYTNMLSLVHYYSDGGGPSRFPQVNRPNRSSSSNRWAQGVGILGAASVLFGKTKYILAALKVTKLASLGSMVLSIGAYSMLFGWPYAIGVVGLIFCHECGHLAVMLNRGIPFSPMVFIPFGKLCVYCYARVFEIYGVVMLPLLKCRNLVAIYCYCPNSRGGDFHEGSAP